MPDDTADDGSTDAESAFFDFDSESDLSTEFDRALPDDAPELPREFTVTFDDLAAREVVTLLVALAEVHEKLHATVEAGNHPPAAVDAIHALMARVDRVFEKHTDAEQEQLADALDAVIEFDEAFADDGADDAADTDETPAGMPPGMAELLSEANVVAVTPGEMPTEPPADDPDSDTPGADPDRGFE